MLPSAFSPRLSAREARILCLALRALWTDRAFRSMGRYLQHGGTSCLLHSIAVAYYSLLLMRVLHIPHDARSLARGALLHDYFLYDWHTEHPVAGFHRITHPRTALRNARRAFPITPLEADIIRRHMFPLTLTPPRYRESAVVCLVDKACSLCETLRRDPYSRGVRRFERRLARPK